MAQIISAIIDLNKIDKSKVQTKDKNGNPFKNGAKYLNVNIVINDEADQYGNTVSIRVAQSEEERKRKDKPTYLGNGKIVWQSEQSNQQSVSNSEASDTDDLPF